MINKEIRESLVEHLSRQYKIYRDEAKNFVSYSFTSVPFFLTYISLVFINAKENPLLLLTIPFFISIYSVFLNYWALSFHYNSEYSDLCAKKINYLYSLNLYDYPKYWLASKYFYEKRRIYANLYVYIFYIVVNYISLDYYQRLSGVSYYLIGISMPIFCFFLIFVLLIVNFHFFVIRSAKKIDLATAELLKEFRKQIE